MSTVPLVLSIDPGTHKCGVAIVRGNTAPQTVHRAVIPTPDLSNAVRRLLESHAVEAVLIGDATYGKTVAKMMRPLLPASVPIHFVPEAYTSERGKKRWCQENPPRSLWERLLPGCRTPTEPIDDYAAVILAEDWLNAKLTGA